MQTTACTLGLDFAAIATWRDGLAPADRAREIAQHVGTCAECQSHIATLTRMAGAVRGDNPRLAPAHDWRPRMWHELEGHIAHTMEASPMTRPPHLRRNLGIGVGAVAALMTLALLIGLVIQRGGIPPGTAPDIPAFGWQRVDPPQVGQVTTFAISQDVPGLAFALTGDYSGSRSTDQPKVATLWRTRDGGTSWATLTQHPPFTAGDTITALSGDQGALTVNDYTNGGLFFSPDAGATWNAVQLPHAGNTNVSGDLTYRAGTLYLFGQGQFWRSTDRGQTWQQIFGPATEGQAVTSIAPDYRAPNAWYRVVQYGTGAPQSATNVALVQHSGDGGLTWQSVQTLPTPTDIPLKSANTLTSALATTPALPGRFCVALTISGLTRTTPTTTTRAAITAWHPQGPPGPTFRYIFVTGNTAHGPAQQLVGIGKDFNGLGALAAPGIIMDAGGTCYAIVIPVSYYTSRADSEIWTVLLGPVPGVTATSMQPIAGETVTQFAVTPDGGHQRLTVAEYATHGLVTCINDDPCPGRFAYPTHLIRRDL